MNTKKPLDISKELEVMNITMLEKPSDGSYLQTYLKQRTPDKKETEINFKHRMGNEETQHQLFQKAMKVLLTYGIFLGLNPVSGLLSKELTKIRCVLRSLKVLYSLIVIMSQTVVICSCSHRLLVSPISIKTLGTVCFYFSTWCTTIVFLRITTRWSNIVKAIYNCKLDEYMSPNITKRVKIVCIVSSTFALVEYILATLTRIAQILDCTAHEDGVHEEYMKMSYPWLYTLRIPYSIPLLIAVQLFTLIAALNWNYTIMFILCTSLYLVSIFDEINKKIALAANVDDIPPSKWIQLRQDYTRATRLVRSFDEVFSGLILISFASNLFLICLQLYNVLTNGLHLRQVLKLNCPNFPSGLLGGYEYTIYLVYTLSYLILRFLTVSLVAANVNVYALIPVTALYRIPACSYCTEVQRFVDQIHGDTVALSGLKFFYITRELILSIAATIVTYDLVVLQFRSHDHLSES